MSSIDSIYLVFLATGFTVGFGHCIGMCGPIVIAFALQLKDRPSFFPQLAYNIGRTITYGLLGAAVGAMASFTRFTEGGDGLQKAIMILAGVVIILMGLGMNGWIPAGRLFGNMSSVTGMVTSRFKQLMQYRSMLIFLPIGMLLGLLPCGPVYTAMIAAARVGMETQSTLAGAVSGFALMVCFGLGTIPALLLLSQVSHVKWLKHRDVIYKIGGCLMILMGMYFAWKGIRF